MLATHSLKYLTKIGIDNIRNHNVSLSNQLINAIAPQYIVSPKNEHQRSGTMIINFKEHQEKIITALKANNILFDARAFGIRLLPHIYNTKEEMEKVAAIISAQL